MHAPAHPIHLALSQHCQGLHPENSQAGKSTETPMREHPARAGMRLRASHGTAWSAAHPLRAWSALSMLSSERTTDRPSPPRFISSVALDDFGLIGGLEFGGYGEAKASVSRLTSWCHIRRMIQRVIGGPRFLEPKDLQLPPLKLRPTTAHRVRNSSRSAKQACRLLHHTIKATRRGTWETRMSMALATLARTAPPRELFF